LTPLGHEIGYHIDAEFCIPRLPQVGNEEVEKMLDSVKVLGKSAEVVPPLKLEADI
jgi:hypothetical protein